MMDKQKLTVLIVGCGNIAGRFDEQRSPESLPYTHAGAYRQDGRFEVLACVDPDAQRRQAFMQYWSVDQGFAAIEDAVSAGYAYDVISLCSPSSAHFQDLQTVIRLKPKLIFCEKPVTYSVQDTEKIIAACAASNILLLVNYTRTWDPAVIRLKANIATGLWGELRAITGLYNKGILNNGSHMLDLLYFLLGSMTVLKVGRPVFDFFSDDPTVSVFLEDSHGLPIHLVAGHAEDYAVFELQLVFSKGILVMEEGGLSWRERGVEDNAIIQGYRRLTEGHFRQGEYGQAMLGAVDHIYHAINSGAKLLKSGEQALKVQRLCEQIKQVALATEIG
ncbi:MAG: Gfo/Idh/MocA family oxidoreductase [Methylococcaceae bacterium]|nr:Gfo/Idh/MocA family oxidoreductase [Methylococcaceae bacterium]